MQKGFSNVLLVVIGVIIALAAIGFFTISSVPHSNTTSSPGVILPNDSTSQPQPDSTSSPQATPSLPPTPTPPAPVAACGINIASPASNEVVGPVINIAGYIDGACHWTPFEAQAGTVRAYNSNGLPLSSTSILSVSGDWTQLPANFTAKLTINTPAHTATGYLLFTNENPSDQFPETYQLPIRF